MTLSINSLLSLYTTLFIISIISHMTAIGDPGQKTRDGVTLPAEFLDQLKESKCD